MYTTPDEMLKEISAIMDANMQAFHNGQDVDMVIFDEKVRNFCKTLVTLPKFEAKKYEDQLKVVIENLTSFIPKLEAKRDELEEKINSLNQRKTAYNAYGNALILAMQTAEE